MNDIAHAIRISDLLEEYATKLAALPLALEDWNKAQDAVRASTSINGAYGGDMWHRSTPSLYLETMQRVLLVSAWRRVYDGLNIAAISTSKDREAFERSMERPPEFTADNIRGTFGEHVMSPRLVILRGLAEVFCGLDKVYRSHSNVKIGVKGLPKRVIIESCGETYSYGFNRLSDLVGALAAYRGIGRPSHMQLAELHHAAKKNGSAEWVFIPEDEEQEPIAQGVRLKLFKNGNAHVMFDERACLDINLALAEFYGDALPDAPEENPTKKESTAVAKDLAFYRTPEKVAWKVINKIYKHDDIEWVLEPSCGDGALLDLLVEFFKGDAAVAGVEVDPDRVKECRMKRHAVYEGNFLEMDLEPMYGLVVMNPPFYGKHWMKHVRKAWSLLKPGGQLLAILPGSAWHDGHLSSLDLPGANGSSYYHETWTDLPPGSFIESGTGVPTGIFDLTKRK